MISNKPHPSTHKNAFVLLLILFVFALPLLVAFYLAKHPGKLSQTTTNRGQLVIPVISVEDLTLVSTNGTTQTIRAYTGDDLRHKWLLIFDAPAECSEQCVKNTFFLNQIHAALGKKSPHFTPVYVNNDVSISLVKQLQQQFSRVTFVSFTPVDQNTFKKRMPVHYQTDSDGAFYLIDPRGNIMMYYAGTSDGNDILHDLERLLKE